MRGRFWKEAQQEMLDIPTLFSRIWFQHDVSQSYEIVAHFSKWILWDCDTSSWNQILEKKCLDI
jgi:hypothetical protein